MAAFAFAAAFGAARASATCSASSVNLNGSCFAGGDGNQDSGPAATPGPGNLTDWQDLVTANTVVSSSDPDPDQTVYDSGVSPTSLSELDPNSWSWIPGSSPQKANAYGAFTNSDPSGDLFLNMSFVRQSGSGQTFAGFELNQNSGSFQNQYSSNVPIRTTGDILIDYEINTTNVTLGMCKWVRTGTTLAGGGPDYSGHWTQLDGTVVDSNTKECTPLTDTLTPPPGTSCLSASACAIGATNGSGPITNYLPGLPSTMATSIPTNQFGEATVNISKLLTSTLNRCVSFGQVWLHTRSSIEINSTPQDVVLPKPISVSTCAVKVDKQVAVNNGSYQGAGDFDSTAGPDVTAHVGDTLNYKFIVKNTGTEPLTNIQLSDDPACTLSAPVKTGTSGTATEIQDSTLAPFSSTGETWTYTCSHVVQPIGSGAGHDPNPLIDTGTVTSQVATALGAVDTTCTTTACSPTDDDKAKAALLDPAIHIVKTEKRHADSTYVSGPINVHGTDLVDYRFAVTNTGTNAPLTITQFDDPNCGTAPSSPFTPDSGDTNSNGKLDAGETWIYTCSHQLTGTGDFTAGSFTNTVTIHGQDALQAGTANDVTSTSSVVANLIVPGINVVKTEKRHADSTYVAGPINVHATDLVDYRFAVTNTGTNAPLTITDFTDAHCDTAPSSPFTPDSGDTNSNGKLDAGETWIYHCSHQLSSGDFTAGSFTNHVSVTGTDALNGTATDTDDVVANLITPGIHVVKTEKRHADSTFVAGPIEVHANDLVDYRFAVTNTGSNAPLTITDFTDAHCDTAPTSPFTPDSGDTNSNGKLDAGETWIYTCSHQLTGTGDFTSGSFTNHVSVTGRDSLGGTDTDTDEVVANLIAPGIQVVKTEKRHADANFVSGPIKVHGTDLVDYHFEVTNTTGTPLTITNFTDAHCDTAPGTTPDSGDTNSNGLLDSSETWVYHCSHQLAPADFTSGSFTNHVSVTGTDNLGGTATDTDDVVANLIVPGINVVKTEKRHADSTFVAGPIQVHGTDLVDYRFAVTNTGSSAPLTVTDFTDAHCDSTPSTTPDSGDTNSNGKLDAGETWIYHCSHQLAPADFTSGSFTNHVSVTGTDELGGTATDTDDVVANLIVPGINVVKTEKRHADPNFVAGPIEVHATDLIDYRFAVTNTGSNAPLTITNFTDAHCDTTPSTTPDSGDTNSNGKLDAGETWIYHCSHQLTGTGDFTSGSFTNHVSVTGTDALNGTATDTDDVVANLIAPGINVVKTEKRHADSTFVAGPIQVHANDLIDYHFDVTNTTGTPLTITNFTDAHCDTTPSTTPDSGDTNSNGKLDTGETWVYHCSHQLTGAGDFTSGSFTNHVSVTGTDSLGGTATDTDDVVANLIVPGINVVKTEKRHADSTFVAGPIQVHSTDLVDYKFAVTNTGSNAPLTITDFTDAHCDSTPSTTPDSGDTNSNGKLDAGETWIYHCSHQLSSGDFTAGSFTNHVSVTGTDALGGTATDTDDVVANLITPGIHVVKTEKRHADSTFVGGPIDVHATDLVDYRFAVTNTGSNAPLTITDFTDAHCDSAPSTTPDSGDTNSNGKLDAGETWIYHCSHQLSSGDFTAGSFTNHVSVTGTDALGGTATDTDDVVANLVDPGIHVVKTEKRSQDSTYVGGPIEVHATDVVDYRFEVTNTGSNAPLTVTDFTDAHCDSAPSTTPDSGDTNSNGKLDAGETWIYHCSHQLSSGDFTAGSFTNHVSVTGTDQLGGTATDTDDVVANLITPSVTTVKAQQRNATEDANYTHSTIDAHVGDTIQYRFTVTNTGNTPLTIQFTDPRCDNGTITGPSGDTNSDNKLDTTETWVYHCSHVLTSADVNNQSETFTNTVTVVGTDDLGGTSTAEDSVVTHALKPAIAISKSGPATATEGDLIPYTLTVTNPGNTAFAAGDVQVTDQLCSSAPALQAKNTGGGADATPNTLDPGDSWVYTCSVQTHSGDSSVNNKACVSGTDSLGQTVDACGTATTTLAQIVVAGERVVVPGEAHIAGKTGCVARKFNVKISGKQIDHVVIRIDGKKRALVHAAANGTVTFKVDPRKYKPGSHLLVAKTFFTADSGTPPKTLKLRFARCIRRTAPAFTG